MQLKIEKYYDIIVEWIPYNQFNSIKEIGKGGFATVYLAIWKDGPLKCTHTNNNNEKEYKRTPNEEVTLKCLNNSQNVISYLLNEV
jgi:serine/threonine protein kinase